MVLTFLAWDSSFSIWISPERVLSPLRKAFIQRSDSPHLHMCTIFSFRPDRQSLILQMTKNLKRNRKHEITILTHEVILLTMPEIVPLQFWKYSNIKERKKQEQRMQVRNERAEECGKTAYKPVAKAMAIAPMPIMVKIKAQTKFFARNSSPLHMVIKKWRNTAHSEETWLWYPSQQMLQSWFLW